MRLHQIDDFVALVLHNVVASPGTAVDFLEALVLRWPSSASPEGVAGVTSCLGCCPLDCMMSEGDGLLIVLRLDGGD